MAQLQRIFNQKISDFTKLFFKKVLTSIANILMKEQAKFVIDFWMTSNIFLTYLRGRGVHHDFLWKLAFDIAAN